MSMQTNEHIYEHGGIRTRLTAVAEGILRITRTRRAAFLEESSPSVVCRGTISAQLTGGEDTVLFAPQCGRAGATPGAGAPALFAGGDPRIRS